MEQSKMLPFRNRAERTLINTLTKKWKTKQFNCRAGLQKGCALHCVNTSIHLLVWSTGNLSSSPARLTLRGEWKTWSSSAQAARTATATPAPGPASWSLTACSQIRIPPPAQSKDKLHAIEVQLATLSALLKPGQNIWYIYTLIMLSTTSCRGKNPKTEATAKPWTQAIAFQGV